MAGSKEVFEHPQAPLFRGEKINFAKTTKGATPAAPDEEINRKYIAGEVRIVTEQARYPMNAVLGMVDSDQYELSPDFQRRHRWSPEKQSRLIESFIMNVPVPPIFLYEDEFSHYEVMDGLQRLTAVADFYRGKLELVGLTEWPELNGRSYSTMPDQVRRGIDRRYLSSIILLHETAKTPEEAVRLKQMVFERINSGGERLTEQETRNAIYDGPLNRLCIRLSRNKYLCRMWGIPEPTAAEISGKEEYSEALDADSRYRTMADVELVLRFFAHRQRTRIGSGAFHAYLDEYLKNGNLFSKQTLASLAKLFQDTVELVYEVFGEKAFWLWRYRQGSWGWLERPTTSVYDAMMFVFSQNLHQKDQIVQNKEKLAAGIMKFYEENVEKFDLRMTNLSNIRERDILFAEYLRSTVAAGGNDR